VAIAVWRRSSSKSFASHELELFVGSWKGVGFGPPLFLLRLHVLCLDGPCFNLIFLFYAFALISTSEPPRASTI
jgi:hypothetical protein